MTILVLAVAGTLLLVMSFALKNVNELEKVATFQRNYPKMMEYNRIATMLITGIVTLAGVLALAMLAHSYNFYHS